MSEAMDLDTPIDVLMTISEQASDDDPDGPGTLVSPYISRIPDYPSPREMQFQAELKDLIQGDMPGSLREKVPDNLYVFSRGRLPDNCLDIARVFYGKSLFVISYRVKRILESLKIKNSEFYPVSMVYSTKGVNNTEDCGGGPVVSGTHWLWWCFATLNLVDFSNTEAVLTPRTQKDHSEVNAPLVNYCHVGRGLNDPPIKVVLKRAPYEESDAFAILGWRDAGLIVSPNFVKYFTESGLIPPYGPIVINALSLDGPRYAKVEIDFRKKMIPKKPPLRIFGTGILASDSRDPPFYARRSPYFPLPIQNI